MVANFRRSFCRLTCARAALTRASAVLRLVERQLLPAAARRRQAVGAVERGDGLRKVPSASSELRIGRVEVGLDRRRIEPRQHLAFGHRVADADQDIRQPQTANFAADQRFLPRHDAAAGHDLIGPERAFRLDQRHRRRRRCLGNRCRCRLGNRCLRHLRGIGRRSLCVREIRGTEREDDGQCE